MNRSQRTAVAGIAVLTLALTGCTTNGANVPLPSQGAGTGNASSPQTNSSEGQGQPSVGSIETQAPQGGAAARVGGDETVISTVACANVSGRWTMSGSDGDQGAKVAVTGPEDRSAVETANVVLADGRVVQVQPGTGSASIVWEGETFTVTGRGPLINLNSPDTAAVDTDFVITATCPQ